MMMKCHPLFAPPLPRIVGVASDTASLTAVRAGDCDIVELRVDALPEEEQYGMSPLLPTTVPVLLTCRDATEGGHCVISQAERVACIERLLPMAAALDWEIAQQSHAKDLLSRARAAGIAWVASAHFFDRTPEVHELESLEQSALSAGADLVKIAFTPQNMQQVEQCAEWLVHARHAKPVALMGMGNLAEKSRLYLCERGSALLYGYLGSSPSAPGQMSMARCREIIGH